MNNKKKKKGIVIPIFVHIAEYYSEYAKMEFLVG